MTDNSRLNILHINYADAKGGAALAGSRLHQALLAQGVNSQQWVHQSQKTICNSETLLENTQPPFLRNTTLKMRRITRPIEKALALNYVTITDTWALGRPKILAPYDVVTLHNLHGGYFNYLAIPAIAKHKPIVWYLHDMWPLTGHCAYSFNCERWKIGCGHCPDLKTYPAVPWDNTHLELQLKRWVVRQVAKSRKGGIHLVAPSRWLYEAVKKSTLAPWVSCHHIAYGIDLALYAPMPQHQARQHLNMAIEDKMVLLVADSLSDQRKGLDLLMSALSFLPDALKHKIVLGTLGTITPALQAALNTLGVRHRHFGYLTDDGDKRVLYNAADAVVCPTRQDNLPLVLMESLACGTPMISFNAGGVGDIVKTGQTGYLAQAESAQDFGMGIINVLDYDTKQPGLYQVACRALAENEFSMSRQAQRFKSLYQLVTQQ